jgi:putative peptidoglycan lipid II flippase
MTLEPALLEEETIETTAANTGLVRAAGIIAAGNVASRVLGLVRETVIAYLFGATGYVSAFLVAATIIQTLYDFLVGGMVSAALVPVFSDFAARENRCDASSRDIIEPEGKGHPPRDDASELWRVASVVINVLAIALASVVLVLEIFAAQLAWILGSGYDPALQDSAVEMIRLILPAVFFLGMSGVITSLLYALKRFTYPAFTTAVYNLGIVVMAFALAPILGISSLIVGILVGSALQVALQLPGLRGMKYRIGIDLSHPALRRILRLYVPVVGGLAISTVGVAIDRNLASHTGAQSLAWMQKATVLIQFPLGLVATAISFAILPELSRQATVNSRQTTDPIFDFQVPTSSFQQTLAFGLKLVLLLILPATAGLFVLARPIVALLFEHGAFTAADTFWTATALQYYLIGLPFAAIDQPLVFACYARKNTLAPNLVAFAGVAIYLIVALALIQTFGMLGLVIANSAQLTGHALLMLWLTQTWLGGIGRQGVFTLTAKTLIASVAMALVAFAIIGAIESTVGSNLLKVVVPTAAAGVVYIALLRVLRVREADWVWQMVWARVRGCTPPSF